jgi:hypothetical protein
MRAAALGLTALFIVACGGAESGDMDEAAGLSASDLAGTWDLRAYPAGSDSAVTYQVVATADPAGWTMRMPGREPVGIRVTIAGDSLVTVTGPFESVLRPGVMVTTTMVARLENGRMVGTMVARYEGAGADSVLTGRIEGTPAAQ